MIVLGIETSCDETSVSLVSDGREVLSNVIASSRLAFEDLAGVIPEEAARKQVECMIPVLREALHQADMPVEEIDAIAVTRGPGLLGSLLVGTTTARALAYSWQCPLLGIHHTLGHLSSPWLIPAGAESDTIHFPVLTLSASGGHTDLWYRTSHTSGKLIGRTRDDAAGEAFDKGASILGLPYPGGPSLSRAAHGGDPRRYPFPLPLRGEQTLDFSFSGLKTAFKYLLRDNPKAKDDLANVSASYQEAICNHLLDRVEKALDSLDHVQEVHAVGGVSANTRLRELLENLCSRHHLTPRTPLSIAYCTDNAAMVASAGYFYATEIGADASIPFETLASLPLEETLIRPIS